VETGIQVLIFLRAAQKTLLVIPAEAGIQLLIFKMATRVQQIKGFY